MSDISTTYAYFSAIDYAGNNTTTGYALSGTPLKFIPELPPLSNGKVTWTFGDGTISKSLRPSKYYKYPGEYEVNLFVYDCNDNSLLSVFKKNITIEPYIPTYYPLVSTTSDDSLEIETGKFQEFHIRSFFPPFQPVSSIFFNLSGSNSTNYFSISGNKFSHLQRQYCFYETLSNVGLSANEYREIDQVILKTQPIFAKIKEGNLVISTQDDSETFFVGVSGEKTVYFKDDTPSDKILINFHHDKSKQVDFPADKPANYLNLTNYTLSASIKENQNPEKVSITSNGMDGEKTPLRSFNFNDIKFQDVKIPFVIKIKDDEWFSVKDFGNIDLSAINVSVLSGDYLSTSNGLIVTTEKSEPIMVEPIGVINSEYYTLSSLNATLSSIDHGGSFRGYVKFSNIPHVLDMVTLSANVSVTNSTSAYTLSGTTSNFALYPKNHYNIAKIHENIDFSEIFKDLRFQEFLLDDEVLFDDFMGTIFGNLSSDSQTLGKKLHEKIFNYFTNHRDIDRCEIISLISEMEMMDSLFNVYEKNLLNSPSKIKRILDLASISKNKLFGETNKFDENFDLKGYSTKEIYGRNLGEQVDFSTYRITPGVPVVSLEKFSNEYTKLNTELPGISGNSPLSSYSPDWGWPLILPSDYSPDVMEKYYLFFEYVDVYDGAVSDNTINTYDTTSTVPSSIPLFDNRRKDFVFENILIDTLYETLSLFDS